MLAMWLIGKGWMWISFLFMSSFILIPLSKLYTGNKKEGETYLFKVHVDLLISAFINILHLSSK